MDTHYLKQPKYFDNVNNGNPFPAKYDRRHDLSITASHKLNDKWTLSTVFVYATGNSITLPTERYVIGGDVYTEYTSRNGYKMPPYHRLDIGATFKPNLKENTSLHGIFQYIMFTAEKIHTLFTLH